MYWGISRNHLVGGEYDSAICFLLTQLGQIIQEQVVIQKLFSICLLCKVKEGVKSGLIIHLELENYSSSCILFKNQCFFLVFVSSPNSWSSRQSYCSLVSFYPRVVYSLSWLDDVTGERTPIHQYLHLTKQTLLFVFLFDKCL